MSERPERIVVVGAGMAAVRLVELLRAHGHDGPITVLGDEPHPPYNRILLSAVLEGTHRVEALRLRDLAWYAEQRVELRLSARVARIDRPERVVELVDGTAVPYDRLVLATGQLPTLPPIRGLVGLDGRLDERVHPFRGLEDCLRLLGAVSAHPAPRRAVVVGGGLLGLQVARALAIRGLGVEVVEGGTHLLRSQVGEQAGRVLARELGRLGTGVYCGARAVRLTDAGLRLDNGYELDADLVVLTAGGRPSTALARGADLPVRRGVLVGDDLASLVDPRVHAIGDCAEHAGRTPGLVAPAWEQAAVLAERIAGGDAVFTGARSVARLRATDLDVAVIGEPETAEGERVVVANPLAGSHRTLVVRDGVIVAAALVGDLAHAPLITQHVDRGTVLGPDEPGRLLLSSASGAAAPTALPDAAEVCACAGVTAGAVRACTSLDEVVTTTRATTGCGGCAPTVRRLLAGRPLEGALR